ncbi:four-helix bundle copper-binding protein [Gloeocapsopsis dulcis]|nr:four-helix bundle copper-binding protein [Gloeocapsopsis dulcis]
MPECARLCRDCAQICWMIASFMSRSSRFIPNVECYFYLSILPNWENSI